MTGLVIAPARREVANSIGFLSQWVSGNTKGWLLKVLVSMKCARDKKLMYRCSYTAGEGEPVSSKPQVFPQWKGGELEWFLLLENIATASPSPAATTGTCKTHFTGKGRNCFLQRQHLLTSDNLLPAPHGAGRLAEEIHQGTGPRQFFPQQEWKRVIELCAGSRYASPSHPVRPAAPVAGMQGLDKQQGPLGSSSAYILSNCSTHRYLGCRS